MGNVGWKVSRHWKRSIASSLRSLPLYLALIAWAASTFFTFAWLLSSSLKTNQELFQGLWSLPKHLTLDNYRKAWGVVHMKDYFLNSVKVVSATLVLVLLASSPAAYVLARIPFRGSYFLLLAFIAGMAIPMQVQMVPTFFLLRRMHLVNTHAGLILIYAAGSLPFSVFLLTSFFKTLPSELEDAAAIDGASEFGVFWRIMLPLASPGIITVGIFNFVWLWNEYIWALVLLQKGKGLTLPVGLYALRTSMQYSADWVALFAGVIIVVLPSFLVFIFFSRRIISGLTVGALKG